ncbi:hypothetical protein HanIR_Chr15g0780201 [Helianthus annuus]|nr:hypothetical protein HanIR_Chr15g0780201 [Helianthus annuus]
MLQPPSIKRQRGLTRLLKLYLSLTRVLMFAKTGSLNSSQILQSTKVPAFHVSSDKSLTPLLKNDPKVLNTRIK